MSKFDVQPYSTRLDVMFTEQDRFVAVLNQGRGESRNGHVERRSYVVTARTLLPDWKVMRHDGICGESLRANGRLVAIATWSAARPADG